MAIHITYGNATTCPIVTSNPRYNREDRPFAKDLPLLMAGDSFDLWNHEAYGVTLDDLQKYCEEKGLALLPNDVGPEKYRVEKILEGEALYKKVKETFKV